MSNCRKRSMTLLDAMLTVANARGARACKRHGWQKRNERRYYFCEECEAFHVTSMSRDN